MNIGFQAIYQEVIKMKVLVLLVPFLFVACFESPTNVDSKPTPKPISAIITDIKHPLDTFAGVVYYTSCHPNPSGIGEECSWSESLITIFPYIFHDIYGLIAIPCEQDFQFSDRNYHTYRFGVVQLDKYGILISYSRIDTFRINSGRSPDVTFRFIGLR